MPTKKNSKKKSPKNKKAALSNEELTNEILKEIGKSVVTVLSRHGVLEGTVFVLGGHEKPPVPNPSAVGQPTSSKKTPK